MQKVELMAPAGSWEALMAAIQNGADSVYFGIEQLNMRAKAANNFTINDLEKISDLCSKHNIKTYLTLNTIMYDHDLSVMRKIVDRVKETGISAVIASDIAAINYAFTQKVPVHISTQVNITNIESVRFFSPFADVMVLSRELSLRQVEQICKTIEKEQIKGPNGELVRIEVFAHGALCVAVSGKCYMSLHTHNASANRGACIQNCRRKYTVIDEEGNELQIDNEFIMSPKDLCTIDFLDKLIATGVSVLKLEGRGRAPEYVATVTKCYREAIDAIADGTYNQDKVQQWMQKLSTVYNRGFWGGYYLGKKLGEWSGTNGSKATQKKVFVGKGQHYYKKIKVAQMQIDAGSLKQGDKILVIGPESGVYETQISEIRVNNQPVPEARKGELVTFPIDRPVKPSDKVYKLVDA
jgi:putative protease